MNSKIILAKNIKLDKDHKNVLNYTESQMLDLLNNSNNIVATNNSFSFIRNERNRIQVSFNYSQCLQSNYLAYQNPDYSNKWFFAFIDEVRYINDKVTEIVFTNDPWATWFDSFNYLDCYVLREHVNDDSIGSNTMPEPVSTGEYIYNSSNPLYAGSLLDDYIAVGIEDPDSSFIYTNRLYGNIYSGLTYVIFKSASDCSQFIALWTKSGRSIVDVFMLPRELATDVEWKNFTDDTYNFQFSALPFTDEQTSIGYRATISSPTNLNGYTPKNNKLFTFPYSYFYVTNNVGSDVIYHYEDFIDNEGLFEIVGCPCPGASIKAIPLNYKKLADNLENLQYKSFNEGLVSAKYPTCSWSSDVYINWLTQNAVNIATSGLSSSMMLASGNAMGLAEAGATFNDIYQHSKTPFQTNGNISAGDVTYACNKKMFDYYKVSVRSEIARYIDEYFSKFGYSVNRLKKPNIDGRENWNYIQIGANEIFVSGSFSNNDRNIINNIARSGVTIWHNHNNIGNYALSNNIN